MSNLTDILLGFCGIIFALIIMNKVNTYTGVGPHVNVSNTVKKTAKHSWEDVHAQKVDIIRILNETEAVLNEGENL